MARQPLLSEKQLAVLRWVADGRPKGIYDADGFAHRVTARALERRGLLSVRGHGSSWRAVLTDDGQYYLEHGDYSPRDEPKLTMSLPEEEGLAQSPNANPRLIQIQPQRPSVYSPGEPDHLHAEADFDRVEIQALMERPALLLVGSDTRRRALAVVQAVLEECELRGWQLTVDDEPSFLISVGEDHYRCVLQEEREKRDVYTDEDLATRRYDWQRVSPTRKDVWSRRLRLDVGPRHMSQWWADRKRWTLLSKLPEIMRAIEEMSAAARVRRDRLAAAHERQLEQWEAAIPLARERHLHALNLERASGQLTAWRRARDLRRYAAAVEAKAAEVDPDAEERAQSWAAWLLEEADRIDPLNVSGELAVEEPAAIRESELDKYMPNGWTVRRPPEPPKWLPS